MDATGQVFPPEATVGGGAIGVASYAGNIVNSIFRNNSVTGDYINTYIPRGGALHVGVGAFTGDIINTFFENNIITGTKQGQSFGGAVDINVFQGNILGGHFINNKSNTAYEPSIGTPSVASVGGALSISSFRGVIDGTEFRDNGFIETGGAIHINSAVNGQIRNARFVNNLGVFGGAVSVVDYNNLRTSSLVFSDNTFIGNTVSGRVLFNDSAYFSSIGGAVGIYNDNGNLSFNNNVFLGNKAINESGLTQLNGWGGAIVSMADKGDQFLTIAAVTGGRTLFYGNRHNGDSSASETTPNALHFGNNNPDGFDRSITATMDAAANGRILMFDPLSAQADGFSTVDRENNPYDVGNLSTLIQKTGSGAWYLGGESKMRGASTWNIDDGSLVLTTVDYGGATGVQPAHVNLSHTGTAEFNLNPNAALSGSGTITAKTIQLNGNLSPETWVNTGMRADAITTSITDAEIASIEVSKAATDGDFGELTFNGDVTMSNATYHLDAHIDDSTHDRLTINGALNVANASTINIRSLTFTDPHLPDTDDDLYTVASVITASGGITGDDLISVTAGGNEHVTDADFLQVRGRRNDDGDAYDLFVGLSWRSNVLDGNNEAVAHGDFTVDELFILNADLHSRAQAFAGNATVHGWEGDTLTKKGEGTLILNGQNTYQGLTTVEGGTLLVGDRNTPTAEIAGSVEVREDATLSGAGTIGGDVDVSGRLQGATTIQGALRMRSGATLSPGFSIGEQRTAHLRLESGSTYEVEINAQGLSDRTVVRANDNGDGAAVIEPNVTLRVLNAGDSTSGWKKETRYDIIDTDGGHTGQFSTIDNRLAFLDATVLYDDPLIVQLLMTRNGNPFESICETHNQCETGGGLTDLEGEDPDHAVIDAIIGLEPDEARHALDNLSGEIYGSTRSVLMQDQHLRDALTRRMISRTPQGQHLWVNTWGQRGSINGNANETRVDVSGMGLALGIDRQFTPNLLAGAFVAYEDKRITNGNHRNARSDVDGFSAGVYAAGKLDTVELRAGAAYSRLDIDVRRDIAVGNLQGRVKSNTKGHKVQVFAEAARPIAVNENVTVSPYVNVTQSWLRTNAATESGNAAALHVERQSDSARFATLGVRAAVQLPTQTPMKLTADLGWVRVFGDTGGVTHHRFANTNARFSPRGVSVGRNRAQAGVGLQAQVSTNTSLSVSYQGQFGSGHRNHAAQVQLRVRF